MADRPGGRPGAIYRASGIRSGSALPSWDDYVAGWSALHGGYDVAGALPIMRGWLRLGYRLGALAATTRLSPHTVTGLGILLSVGVPVAANGRAAWPVFAGALVVASAVADTVDGALAVVSGRVTRFGQVYDSLADRICEACWLVAFAVLGVAPWLVGLCGAVTWLQEHLRARASAAGMPMLGTLTPGERPIRIMIVAVSLLLAGAGSLVSEELTVGTLTAAAAIWAMLQVIAFLQLLAVVHRGLR